MAAALSSRAEVEAVFVDAGTDRGDVADLLDQALARGARLFELSPGVLARVADTVTPQPVVAIVRQPTAGLSSLRGAGFVVVGAEVRDPGNAGTVIRSADAAGADAVVLCGGSVDPFNPKTVRASAGSVLHLPVVTDVSTADVLDALVADGVVSLGAVAHGGTPYTDVDLTRRLALVFGNEAAGLPPETAARLDGHVSIPMPGRAESLNVSMAASVLCFEVLRQRSSLVAMPERRSDP